MSVRNFRVHEKRDGTSYSILLDSRLKTETLMFESGALAELSETLQHSPNIRYTCSIMHIC